MKSDPAKISDMSASCTTSVSSAGAQRQFRGVNEHPALLTPIQISKNAAEFLPR